MLAKIPFTPQWWQRMKVAAPQMFDSTAALQSIDACVKDYSKELSVCR